MQHNLSQAELKSAIEYWLNEVKLKRPVTVKCVKPQGTTSYPNYVLHVTVTEEDPAGAG